MTYPATKGLILNIFKCEAFAGCSLNGISEANNKALWIGENAPEIFEAVELPRIAIVKGNLPGIATAVVCDKDGKPRNDGMMGGAYVASSDSRFTKAVEEITGCRFYGAVPLHDRFE